jgi:phage terminase Nu1 subunit (DNA packaging protein)
MDYKAPLADSMEQAASMCGLPISVLKWAKKNGCPAFRAGARVDIDELKAWLEVNDPKDDQADGGDEVAVVKLQKLKNEALLKLEQVEAQRINNAKLRGELQPTKVVCEKLRAISEEIKSTLLLRLVDQLPAQNAGLDAPKQRENNRETFKEICRRFQQFAAEYEKILADLEKRQADQKKNAA